MGLVHEHPPKEWAMCREMNLAGPIFPKFFPMLMTSFGYLTHPHLDSLGSLQTLRG